MNARIKKGAHEKLECLDSCSVACELRPRTSEAGMSLRPRLKPTQKSLYFRCARKWNAETNGCLFLTTVVFRFFYWLQKNGGGCQFH